MKFAELKANWAWFLEHMPDDEPCSFPRREVKRRIANKEKRSRVSFACDPDTYSEFHRERERIMRVLDDNPTTFGLYLIKCLRYWDDEEIRAWKEEQEN
jgi:hypothetical protein